jgi:diketogulonate reductase-like aldo/keto reductase
MMKLRPLGSSGPLVPAIGLGTWKMERGRSPLAAIHRDLDLGAGHIDTAELYGGGEVEVLVGRALLGRRSQAFLVSKVLPHNATRQGTVAACERSLRRLQVEQLDLYLLHWEGPHALEETFAGMEELVRSGKIARYGVSNFDRPLMERALAIAGPGRIACNQVLYHLEERAIERSVLPWCEAHGIAVVGYSPFGSGPFVEPSSPGGRALAEIGLAHGVSPRVVALAFLLRRPSLFAIPKTVDPARVEQNCQAADLELGAAELERLDRAFPLGPEPAVLPTI